MPEQNNQSAINNWLNKQAPNMNQLIVVIDQGDAGIIQDGQLLSNCPKRLMVIDNWINIDGASTQLVDCPNRSKYLSQKLDEMKIGNW